MPHMLKDSSLLLRAALLVVPIDLLQFLFGHSPERIGEVEDPGGMAEQADTPSEQRPDKPLVIGSQGKVDDDQHGHHDDENPQVDAEPKPGAGAASGDVELVGWWGFGIADRNLLS